MPPKRQTRRALDSAGSGSSPLLDASRLARLFEPGADREALERMLVAFALHPQGVGFQSASLLGWNAGRGVIEARCGGEQASPGLPAEPKRTPEGGGTASIATLIEALEQARRPRPRGVAAAESVIRCFETDPLTLGGAPGEAWHQGVAVGSGSDDSPWAGSSAVGAALIRLDGEPYGLLVGEWADSGAPADATARLGALAAFAEIGLAARRRAAESRWRAIQVDALAHLARTSVSTLNLAEAIRMAVEIIARAGQARGSAIWIRHGGKLRLEATHGYAPERDRLGRTLQPLAERMLDAVGPRLIQPPSDEPLVPAAIAAELGAIVIAPLVAYDVKLGVIAVYHGLRPEGEEEVRGPEDIAILGAIADQVAVAIDQASRFDEVRRSRQREREVAVRLRRAERLAALGDVARRAAQEARNPLASIGAFARRMQRGLDPQDPNREYLEIIVREAGRLERLIEEQSEYLTPEAPALKVESVNQVMQEVLQQAGEKLVRRRIRLLKRLAPEMPPLLLDRARIQRVLANVLERALDATPVGGRIRVESRRIQQHAVVEIAHDGPREPGEALDQLFVPFASARTGGPAVGLAVAQQVVREHGGEIRVRGDGEWSAIVTLTLPIRENQDRRQSGPERRRAHNDRRAADPAP